MSARRVVLASGNRGKLREFAELLAGTGFELVRQSELGIEPPPETGNTFLENALIKARNASRLTGLPAIADDSGIEVDALGGAPGVYSARYAGEDASDEANLAKLLAALERRAAGASHGALSLRGGVRRALRRCTSTDRRGHLGRPDHRRAPRLGRLRLRPLVRAARRLAHRG